MITIFLSQRRESVTVSIPHFVRHKRNRDPYSISDESQAAGFLLWLNNKNSTFEYCFYY